MGSSPILQAKNFANRLVGKATNVVSRNEKKGKVYMKEISEIAKEMSRFIDSISPYLTDSELAQAAVIERDLYRYANLNEQNNINHINFY